MLKECHLSASETSMAVGMSDRNMSSAVTHLRKIPWRIALPAITSTLTFALLRLDRIWMKGAFHLDDMPVTTARGLIALLNGPGFLVGRILADLVENDIGLIGAAIFWAWLGYLLDRKFRGVRDPVLRRKWLRLALYVLGLAFACLTFLAAAWHPYNGFIDSQWVWRMWRILRSDSPWRRLLGREFLAIAAIFWGIGYTIYFGHKLWRLAGNLAVKPKVST